MCIIVHDRWTCGHESHAYTDQCVAARFPESKTQCVETVQGKTRFKDCRSCARKNGGKRGNWKKNTTERAKKKRAWRAVAREGDRRNIEGDGLSEGRKVEERMQAEIEEDKHDTKEGEVKIKVEEVEDNDDENKEDEITINPEIVADDGIKDESQR